MILSPSRPVFLRGRVVIPVFISMLRFSDVPLKSSKKTRFAPGGACPCSWSFCFGNTLAGRTICLKTPERSPRQPMRDHSETCPCRPCVLARQFSRDDDSDTRPRGPRDNQGITCHGSKPMPADRSDPLPDNEERDPEYDAPPLLIDTREPDPHPGKRALLYLPSAGHCRPVISHYRVAMNGSVSSARN